MTLIGENSRHCRMENKMMKTQLICSMVLGSACLFATVHASAQSDADKTFLTDAAQSDFNEITLSKLAEQKSTNPQVKSFAEKMVTDHNMLEAKMKPYVEKWGLTPPTALDSDHQGVYDQLNGMSGADFDKQYMQAMDADHHKALDLFKQEESTTTNSSFKAAVKHGESVVAQHTKMADQLAPKVGATANGM